METPARCVDCERKASCSLIPALEWLELHQTEASIARVEMVDAIAEQVELLVQALSMAQSSATLVLPMREVTELVLSIFWVGYYKGRTYTPVPEVFAK